jgi:serine/threonine-protein kinase
VTKLLSKDGEGERLDRFELVAELASGGMATVYLARLSGVAGFQRLFAIKRLHPHLAKEPEFVEMFLDEARLAAKIHHPNIASIHEIGENDGGYYLVMDYIEGDTAARLFGRCALAGKKIPYPVGIRMVLDTLAGLHAAHELKDDNGAFLNVVHRDVSPQNVIVGVDGSSRLIDFGVARASMRLSTTRSGHLKGKLSYMAPEQARGEIVDRRADVFAVGVMLWELLAFRRLFRGEGEADTLNRLLYVAIPNVRDSEPQVHPALERVTMKALERDPDKRFASAWEFADALETAARQVKALGTTRDVASCLSSVMGTEMEAQRTAVRQWLARSEPNQPRRGSGAPSPLPHSPPSGSSSVSSAVIPNPAVSSPSSVPSMRIEPEPERQRRRAVWVGALAAVAVFAVFLGWAKLRPHPEAAVAPSAPATVDEPPPIDPVASADTPGTPAPPDTGVPQQSAPTSRPVRHLGGGRVRPTAHPSSAPPAAPTPPPPAATVPDDLSHNPYR